MRIKKIHLTIIVLFAIILTAALFGFDVWNKQIINNLGRLSQYSFYLILGLAFVAGAVSIFSPCGLALLPAFISYNIATIGNNNKRPPVSKILKVGVSTSLGTITFFVLLGLLFSVLGVVIAPYIKLFQYVIALLFVVLGILLIKKISVSSIFFDNLRKGVKEAALQQSGYKGFYIFGFAYGLDIIGCLFPLISAIILIPIATGKLLFGILTFLIYSIALGAMVTLFVYFISYSKEFISKVVDSSEKIKVFAGYGLVFGGLALLYYYAFFGMAIG